MVMTLTKTIYGDIAIDYGFNLISIGTFGDLHTIYDEAVRRGAKPLKNVRNGPHPKHVFRRVLNGLACDDRFRKSKISYSGIYTCPVNCYVRICPKCEQDVLNMEATDRYMSDYAGEPIQCRKYVCSCGWKDKE